MERAVLDGTRVPGTSRFLDREVAAADRIIRGLLEFARGTPPRLEVERAPGRGSRFTLRVPEAAPHPPDSDP